MKIVYTFSDYTNPGGIHVDTLFCGIFSAFKSNELYGNSTFTATSKLLDNLEGLNLPFTSYEEIEHDITGYNQAYIPKLYSYAQQTTPFIHLDLDLTLFSKIEEPSNYSIRFAHQDQEADFNFINVHGIYKAYLEPAFILGQKYGSDFLKDVHLSHIPNMGIVQVKEPKAMQEATYKALEFYHDNREYFDKYENLHTGIFLEQLLIPKFCREVDLQYYNSVIEKTNFIFKAPTLIFTREEESKYVIDDTYNSKSIYFDSLKELLVNYNFNDLKVAHFLGGSKYDKIVQLLVIHNLTKYMSIESLECIHSRFSGEENKNIELYKQLF